MAASKAAGRFGNLQIGFEQFLKIADITVGDKLRRGDGPTSWNAKLCEALREGAGFRVAADSGTRSNYLRDGQITFCSEAGEFPGENSRTLRQIVHGQQDSRLGGVCWFRRWFAFGGTRRNEAANEDDLIRLQFV